LSQSNSYFVLVSNNGKGSPLADPSICVFRSDHPGFIFFEEQSIAEIYRQDYELKSFKVLEYINGQIIRDE